MNTRTPLAGRDTDSLIAMLGVHETSVSRHDLEREIVQRHLWILDGLTDAYAGRGIAATEFRRLAESALRTAVQTYDRTSGDFVPHAMIVVITEVRQGMQTRAISPRQRSGCSTERRSAPAQ